MFLLKVLFIAIYELIKLSSANRVVRKYLQNNMLDAAVEVAEASTTKFSHRVMEAAKTPVEVIGAQNIDPSKTYLIVSNHQSIFDVPILNGYLGVFSGFIGKQSIAKYPLVGKWISLEICGMIDRSSSRRAIETINKAADILKRGVNQIIFPEGTRTRDGKVHEFKAGAFKIATKAKVEVLPVAIVGAYEMFPKNSFKLRPGDIKLVIHPPIATEGMTTQELATITRDLISATVENHSFEFDKESLDLV